MRSAGAHPRAGQTRSNNPFTSRRPSAKAGTCPAPHRRVKHITTDTTPSDRVSSRNICPFPHTHTRPRFQTPCDKPPPRLGAAALPGAQSGRARPTTGRGAWRHLSAAAAAPAGRPGRASPAANTPAPSPSLTHRCRTISGTVPRPSWLSPAGGRWDGAEDGSGRPTAPHRCGPVPHVPVRDRRPPRRRCHLAG